ncbi:GNAT family N-acetyltransferase [Crossiella cryophila]|uniref:RimJ/RimL family protein N-acetyltransferase n=1 Tax=Crossiella cryophila TaxID=43355 RepID=A0A7W7C8L7_9PSEU|nr:GNAT family protein [Crossiella cryophila]MBB4676528.1 RimJ/RimL family protein N-acetyltransferase [Crossiella cryophila]
MRSGVLLAAVTRRLRPHHPGWPAVLGPMSGHDRAVTLRPPRPADAPDWCEAVRADRKWLEPWWPTSAASWDSRSCQQVWRARCDNFLRAARRGGMIPMVVEVDGRFAGEMMLDRIDRDQGLAELGGWVYSAFHGTAVAATAMRALIRHGFGPVGLRRLTAPVGVGNRAAGILVARNGFRKEGVLRSHMHVGGKLLDHQLWGLLPEDAEWLRSPANIVG